MGNIAPRAVIEPTSLAFHANVLTITPLWLPGFTIVPTLICLCGSLPKRSAQTTILVPLKLSFKCLFNAYYYIQAMQLYIYTYTGYV